MPPIATPADVRRWADTDLSDAAIQPYLDGAEDWVKQYTGYNWGVTGSVTESAYNVRADGIVRVRDFSPTVTRVTVFASTDPSTAGRVLATSEYQVMTKGRIRLIFIGSYTPTGYDTAVASRLVGTYPRVEVVYTANGVVPPSVRDATAIIAAADIVRGGQAVAGYASESIGDYSYSVRGEAGPVPDLAVQKLAPYTGGRVRTV